jgi:hypothetical protein
MVQNKAEPRLEIEILTECRKIVLKTENKFFK